jgi:nucleotide-binding universal stress UspA family protein
MPKQVLVPIDESPRATAALNELSLACDRRDQIILMSVAKPVPGSRSGESRRQQLEELHTFLETKAEELRKRGFRVRVEFEVDPRPARAIIRYARRVKPNLIVMIRRSHDPRRYVFGSVSSEIIKSDVAPVILLPPATGR